MTKTEFKYVTTLPEYEKSLQALSHCSALAADTETYCLPEWEGKGGSALDPHTGRISLLILKGRDTIPYVLDILWLTDQRVDYSKLQTLLLSREYLLWHNAN